MEAYCGERIKMFAQPTFLSAFLTGKKCDYYPLFPLQRTLVWSQVSIIHVESLNPIC